MPQRYFNTAGPIKKDLHYHIAPLQRWDMQHIMELMEQQKYFVVHAPRQTGKTTALLALQDELNQGGVYEALYANVEPAQAARNDYQAGVKTIVDIISENHASRFGNDLLTDYKRKISLENDGWGNALAKILRFWAAHSSKRVVLILDEVDALIGDTLISVLRQIRSGYPERPNHFPQNIILCGVRDIRDYRLDTAVPEQQTITGGSAFNIKAESLLLGNFSVEEIEQLLVQHTEITGQSFESGAAKVIFLYTDGQPWLVNALCYEATFGPEGVRNRTEMVRLERLHRAKELLILRKDTHLDQLTDKLREDRVKRVVQPILSGQTELADVHTDDIQYTIDLGLVRKSAEGNLIISNPIYQEIIPRTLVGDTEMVLTISRQWYISEQGTLDMAKLLTGFQAFFRQHSEHWLERFDYKEAGPQLLLQAFLQRIVNGGGTIIREYGLGRRRTDLFILFPYAAATQKVVIELKILRNSLDNTIEEGMAQTADYMDKCAADEGHLIIFDRRNTLSWEEKLFFLQKSHGNKQIQIWGC